MRSGSPGPRDAASNARVTPEGGTWQAVSVAPEPMETPMTPVRQLCCLLAFAAFAASTARAAVAEPAPAMLVFVGEQLAYEDLDHDPCAEENAKSGGDTICISMDSYYRARYRIVETIHGIAPGPDIEFDVGSHYGDLDWVNARHALLFVYLHDDAPHWLHKYQGFAVFPTADGGWATCGDTGTYDKLPLQDIEFSPALIVDDTSRLTPIAIEKRWDPAVYAVVDGTVRCRRGVPLEAIVTYVDREVLDEVDLGTTTPAGARPRAGGHREAGE